MPHPRMEIFWKHVRNYLLPRLYRYPSEILSCQLRHVFVAFILLVTIHQFTNGKAQLVSA